MQRLLTAAPSVLLTGALALVTPAVAAPASTPDHTTIRAASSAPSITIAAQSNQVERGRKVVVTGAVTSKKITKVTLQQKRAGTPWRAQATAKVRADGSFKVKDKTTTAVIRKYRVVSATGPRAKSAKVTVGVYEWKDLTKLKRRAFSGWGIEKTVEINATPYGPAFRGWVGLSTAPLVDFNVNHNCVSLRGRFGLSDTSDLAGRATISVLGDDIPAYSKSFGITQSEYVTVPLASPFRVGLTFTVENPGGLPTAPSAVPVVAAPELFCTSAK